MISRLVRAWRLQLLLVVALSILASACAAAAVPVALTGGVVQNAQTTAPAIKLVALAAEAPGIALATARSDTLPVTPFSAAASGSQAAASWIERDMQATVKIWTVADQDKNGDLPLLAQCSGSLVDPSGVILTNWHCVGLTSDETEDISEQGLRPGEMYNSEGVIVVGLTKDPRRAPQPAFLARVRQGSPDLDIAVAKIFATLDGGKLPKSLPLTVVAVGDSDKVNLGDPVHLFGYPGVGGELITKTSGQISGFFKSVEGRPDLDVDAFKTDAVMNHGNSGGLAANAKGEAIGIPTFGTSGGEAGGPGLGGIRLVNLAKPFIAKALSNSFDPIPPRNSSNKNGPSGPTTGPSASSKFSNLVFGTDLQGEKLVGQGTQFPSGTKKAVAQFQFSGIKAGTPWGYVLTIDGETAIDKRSAGSWKEQGTAQSWITFDNEDQPLPEGKYELNLILNGSVELKGAFAVAAGKTTAPAKTGVVLKGQIVDADTGRAIPNAYFVLLSPGVTVKEFSDSDASPETMAAAGETDSKGNFRTDPSVPVGQTYGVVVLAKGYKFLGVDNALDLPADSPFELTIDEPVALRKN